jgi:hypothetical protein
MGFCLFVCFYFFFFLLFFFLRRLAAMRKEHLFTHPTRSPSEIVSFLLYGVAVCVFLSLSPPTSP